MADTLESLEIEVKHSASGAADEINKVASAVRSLNRALEKALPNFMLYRNVMGNTPVTFNDNHTTQIAETINNANTAARAAGKATQQAAKGVKELSKQASKSKGPLENLISSLKRIAFYRMIRGVIKAVTDAMQEGLEKAYLFSSMLSTEGVRFSQSLDRLTSAGNQMKGQLGSAFIALIAAVEPLLMKLIELVTRAADAIAQLISAFTGFTYLKAEKTTAKFMDDTQKGAKAAKEWKNQLLGFDEINRLEAPSDSGSSKTEDPLEGYKFVDTPINEKYLQMVQKLKDFLKSFDLEPLRASLGRLKESFLALVDVLKGGVMWAWENILKPLAHWVIEEAAPASIELLASVIDVLSAALGWLGDVFKWLWENWLQPIASWLGDEFVLIINRLAEIFRELAKVIRGEISWSEFWDNLSTCEKILLIVTAAVIVLKLAFLALAHPILAIIVIVAALAYAFDISMDDVKKFFADMVKSVKEKIAELKQTFTEWKNRWKEEIQQIKNKFREMKQSIINDLTAVIQKVKNAIQWFKDLFSWKNKVGGTHNGFASSGSTGFQGSFASGGFPDEGQMFIAREAGPEMVGQIGGRTAVANNDQIAEGISEAVYNAFMRANGNDRPIVVNPGPVYIDGKELMRVTYNDRRAVDREHGGSLINRTAFAGV